MPQATSAIFARLPDRRRWFALRLTSAIRGVRIASRRSFPADPPPGSPLDVPGEALRVRPRDLLRRSGSHSDPGGSSWVPRVRFTLRCPGRSSGPLASITSTAWSEAKRTGALDGGQLRVRAGQTTNVQVGAMEGRVTKGSAIDGPDDVAGRRRLSRSRSPRASPTSRPVDPRAALRPWITRLPRRGLGRPRRPPRSWRPT
jgi:hypothetical protein